MMRKALRKKGFALAILLAFVVALGAGCCGACKKYAEEAKSYADQTAASAAKADQAARNAEMASADAKASADKAEAAADRAEAAAAKAEACLMRRMRKYAPEQLKREEIL
jgi:hypothetical protein